MRFNWSNRPQIKIEPKLECGSLSQREFQVLIFGETLQVDVLYNLEFADYIQDTRIIHSTGKLSTTFRLYFYGPKMSVIYRVHKKQCCPISVHERFTCRSISTNFPIQPSPAQPSPAQQCECFQPVLSVELGADARLTVHRQTQRVMTRWHTRVRAQGGDSCIKKMLLSAKQTYIS